MHKSSVPDYFLAGVCLLLLMSGIIILASVSAAFSIKKFDDTAYFLRHQLLWGLLPGLIAGFILYKMNLATIKKWVPFAFLLNLFFYGNGFSSLVDGLAARRGLKMGQHGIRFLSAG